MRGRERGERQQYCPSPFSEEDYSFCGLSSAITMVIILLRLMEDPGAHYPVAEDSGYQTFLS